MVDMIESWPLSKPEVISLLERHHIVPTQQRVEIAQVLFARPQHLAAEQVLSLVNQDASIASKATVYNTLVQNELSVPQQECAVFRFQGNA